jgi:large subunit ribosomal protein L31
VKKDIHPTWYPDAVITCSACGTQWHTGAAVKNLRVDVCSNCHPFYTGEQRIVDTEGQVDRFMKRLRVRDERKAERQAKEQAIINADIPLEELELGKRYITILNEAGIRLISDLIRKLDEEGDEAVLAIPGIGVKVLADAKRRIAERGYQIAEANS